MKTEEEIRKEERERCAKRLDEMEREIKARAAKQNDKRFISLMEVMTTTLGYAASEIRKL